MALSIRESKGCSKQWKASRYACHGRGSTVCPMGTRRRVELLDNAKFSSNKNVGFFKVD